ncbi:endodeoxyribonuclease [Linnemannia zychae]|nr:endodeoxyribonuclease [Linnemannia zychae]
MIELTESESKEEFDRFCDAMIAIHAKIQEIQDGKQLQKDNNTLNNAPRPLTVLFWNKRNALYTIHLPSLPKQEQQQLVCHDQISFIGSSELECALDSDTSYNLCYEDFITEECGIGIGIGEINSHCRQSDPQPTDYNIKIKTLERFKGAVDTDLDLLLYSDDSNVGGEYDYGELRQLLAEDENKKEEDVVLVENRYPTWDYRPGVFDDFCFETIELIDGGCENEGETSIREECRVPRESTENDDQVVRSSEDLIYEEYFSEYDNINDEADNGDDGETDINIDDEDLEQQMILGDGQENQECSRMVKKDTLLSLYSSGWESIHSNSGLNTPLSPLDLHGPCLHDYLYDSDPCDCDGNEFDVIDLLQQQEVVDVVEEDLCATDSEGDYTSRTSPNVYRSIDLGYMMGTGTMRKEATLATTISSESITTIADTPVVTEAIITPTLVSSTTTKKSSDYMTTKVQSREWVLEQLEGIASQFLYNLSIQDRPPRIGLTVRNLPEAIVYDDNTGIIRRKKTTTMYSSDLFTGQEGNQNQTENKTKDDTIGAYMGAMMSMDGRKRKKIMDRPSWMNKSRTDTTLHRINSAINVELNTPSQQTSLLSISSPRISQLLYPPLLSSPPTTKRPFVGWTTRTCQILRTTELIHQNLSKDIIASKRDLYYRDVVAFGNQTTVDNIVEDLACTLEISRSCLNIVAGTRSVIFGSLRMLVKVPGEESKSEEDTNSCVLALYDNADRPNDYANNGNMDSTFFMTYPFEDKLKEPEDEDTMKKRDVKAKTGHDDLLGVKVTQTTYNTLITIPVRFSDILEIEIHPQTKFVLVTEKEAIFTHLVTQRFCMAHGPCILITSKGFPDQVSRRLLNVLSEMIREGVYIKSLQHRSCAKYKMNSPLPPKNDSDQGPYSKQVSRPLAIPLLALMDCDPHGIEIYLTYRCGSIPSAYDNANLAVPDLKCLGQVPSDWDVYFLKRNFTSNAANSGEITSLEDKPKVEREKHRINEKKSEGLVARFEAVLIPLTTKEKEKLDRMVISHPYIRQHAQWKQEILRMLEQGCKTELQSLYLIDTGSEMMGMLGPEMTSGNGIAVKEETPSSALVAYLQHKLQDPQSWL